MAAIMVSVAAHYVPRRVEFLAQVLLAISQWQAADVTVFIDTNDLALADDPQLAAAVAALAARGYDLRFDRATGMAHPWHLTWWHKPRLREWSAGGGDPDDLFIYVEDDIVITQDNLAYFTGALPAAKAQGRIPGFLRYELAADGTVMTPDARGCQLVNAVEQLVLDGQRFIAPVWPYWAGFVLDRELATEYLASPWSDLELADRLPQSVRHSCRVQSAWALTYAEVPNGVHSRYIVPVDDKLNPLSTCLVWHSANNYVVSKQYNFGTVRMADMFRTDAWGARLYNTAWQARALLRRVSDKVRREMNRIIAK